MTEISLQQKDAFQTALLTWFAHLARVLPWRTTERNPYHVWVSEIMLQQTQVKTVIPYFIRFIEAFPSIASLAAAPLDSVLKYWEGLGYYSRCRNLYQGACYIVAHHQGQLPATPAEILKVPGIGPYTAGAILSIAFGLSEPAVDGNVMRVLSRYFALTDDIAKPTTRMALEHLVRQLMPVQHPGDFTEALMELGALVCTPRQPDCNHCPLQASCRAYSTGRPEAYPVKTKNKEPRLMSLAVGVVQYQEHFLLRQQPEKGIFAGLWCFPFVEYHSEPITALQDYLGKIGYMIQDWQGPVGVVEHTLTHRHLQMSLFLGYLNDAPSGSGWYSLAHMEQIAMPIAHQKIKRFLDAHPLIRVHEIGATSGYLG